MGMKISNITIKILNHLINEADSLSFFQYCRSRFNSKELPPISLGNYVERANKYICCEDPIYIIVFLYIDRLVERHPRFLINSFNAHRLIFTAIVIADKLYSDHCLTNQQYARIGGYRLEDLNKLEWDFLSLIGLNANVTEEQYGIYYKKMIELAKKLNVDVENGAEDSCGGI
eukprot:TRINITY_DN126_c0_g1_i2.p1 TRINITY_DN126_c0_g1~~TRINITY_DN126_c0_g1_i2.p1  ORF type:complete len:173 (-),score=20.14 TRINITY_DN126_c0_g1_i2:160-678(-)